MITDFTKWTAKELVELLAESGYNSDDIIDAKYISTDDYGTVKFQISYEDIEMTEIRFGHVYVAIRNGKLIADY